MKVENDLSSRDIDIIASMHIKASVNAANLKKPAAKFRFFKDKISLFHDFDPGSIIIQKSESNEICGILIFTYDESKFNKFAGPGNMRFYIRALKALTGFYGFDFKKYLNAAKSALGAAKRSGFDMKEKYGKIWVLLVMEEYRKRGIAVELIKKCIEIMRKKGVKNLIVTVKTDNDPAIGTYEKCGFTKTGTCEESSGHSYIMSLKV